MVMQVKLNVLLRVPLKYQMKHEGERKRAAFFEIRRPKLIQKILRSI